MMVTAYWELQFDPFSKSSACKVPFESEDFTQASARLRHLHEIKGIGLFTGAAGYGKTYTLKSFADSLNPSLFKTIYLPLSTVTVLEFFRAVALGLGIDPPYKKIDLFNAIQERILSLSRDKRITAVLMLDEGQYLSNKILNDLKIILNFCMDSENHAVIVISGQAAIANTLSMQSHEALAQRVVINYTFSGLSKSEMPAYIGSRLKACGAHDGIFADSALEALWGFSGGSPRVVNSLAEKCLMIGFQKNAKVINPEIVMLAKNEISLL
jgi:type II secretory pathway predicted ATPase ExeA